MRASVTAMRGSAADIHAADAEVRFLPRALALLSTGLAAVTLGATDQVSRLIGVDDSMSARMVLRAVGGRELLPVPGLLAGRRPAGWILTRIAGDAMDLTLLANALASRRGDRRQRVAITLAAVAGVTVLDVWAGLRAARAGRPRRMVRLSAVITVNRPADEVYRFWHDFGNLPRFMYHLESVRADGNGRSHWTARAPAGRRVHWDAEIVEDHPNELIAWRSAPGTRVPNAGRVFFSRATGGRGTEVRVEMEYAPPAGAVGRAVAKLFGEEPGQQVKDDLRRFKQVIETGEVVRSDGSPDGINVRQQVMQHPARPAAGRPPR